MATCKVSAELFVDGTVIKAKEWPECDIMKTGVTRAWATRQFNTFLKDFARCDIGRDKVISVEWTARYGEAQGYGSLRGRLSGLNGIVMARRGIFED
jgi:hypothetical protein